MSTGTKMLLKLHVCFYKYMVVLSNWQKMLNNATINTDDLHNDSKKASSGEPRAFLGIK